MSIHSASEEIGKIIGEFIPKLWDGKQSVLEMKSGGSRHWRQMEWIGFYFQYLCETKISSIMRIPGPTYGRVQFDGLLEVPWDFKAHAIKASSNQIIVNDSEAISLAIKEYGSVGLILSLGKAAYDDDTRAFQQWHEVLKGGISRYEQKRIERGAWSRPRKVAFNLQQVSFIRLTNEALLKSSSFQSNFRNSDGSPRRSKVLIDLDQIGDDTIKVIEF